MEESIYLKNLNYDIQDGYINFYDYEKKFGFIVSSNLDEDVFFHENDVFNSNQIKKDYAVKFILNDTVKDENDVVKLNAEKVIIKSKREETKLYGVIIDNRKEIWKILDTNGNQYLINKNNIKNQNDYYEDAYIELKFVNNLTAEGTIVYKGYIKSYCDNKQNKNIRKIHLLSDNNQKYSFKLHSLLNANSFKDNQIVYFKRNNLIHKEGYDMNFATDVFLTKEKYNG